ncbi:hypothetical protein ACN077_24540 [Clostridium chromiireducens]|uniref:hypothetical protein n=1 Tax=Clostridium chromiireducens TaxID=225345 RepID=UPI003AF9EF9F
MKNYLEQLIKKVPKENKGYNYISTIEISIPVSMCAINVIRRKETGLQLAEEIIMKLIDNDVTTVIELSEILGLDKEIIDDVVGKLYIKEFITVTAGNCILASKGKKVMESLKEVKLEQGTIAPVFINLITGEIYTDKYSNQADNYVKKDNVLNGKIKINLEYFNERFGDIKDIFDIQQKAYGATKLSKISLYKIESVEENKIQYLNIKSNLYKNKTGEEIEIISQDNIIQKIQSEILEQMINQNKFKYTFKNRNKYKMLSNDEWETKINDKNDGIRKLIKDYNKADRNEEQMISEKFYRIYKADRIIIENELELMIEELSNGVKEINIYINRLGDILFDEEYIIPLCKAIKKGSKIIIYYNFENNLDKTLSSARNNFPEIKNIEIKKEESVFEELIINFENRYEIKTQYYDIKVFGDKYITKSISSIYNLN